MNDDGTLEKYVRFYVMYDIKSPHAESWDRFLSHRENRKIQPCSWINEATVYHDEKSARRALRSASKAKSSTYRINWRILRVTYSEGWIDVGKQLK